MADMTREQRDAAIAWFEQRLHNMERGVFQCDMATTIRVHEEIDALQTALSALRGPVPDPETGLCRCGCGSKAGFHYAVVARDDECYIECGMCGMHGRVVLGEDKARDAWNRAMGYRG